MYGGVEAVEHGQAQVIEQGSGFGLFVGALVDDPEVQAVPGVVEAFLDFPSCLAVEVAGMGVGFEVGVEDGHAEAASSCLDVVQDGVGVACLDAFGVVEFHEAGAARNISVIVSHLFAISGVGLAGTP